MPNCNEKRKNAWKIWKGKNVHFFNDIHLSLSLIRISLPALQDSSNQNCDEDDLEGKGDSQGHAGNEGKTPDDPADLKKICWNCHLGDGTVQLRKCNRCIKVKKFPS